MCGFIDDAIDFVTKPITFATDALGGALEFAGGALGDLFDVETPALPEIDLPSPGGLPELTNRGARQRVAADPRIRFKPFQTAADFTIPLN